MTAVRKNGRLCAVLAAMLWLMAVGCALAADAGRACSLIIEYRTGDGRAIEGAVFRLYRVASVDESGGFAPTEAFAGYADLLSGGDWKALADQLSGHASADEAVSPYVTPTGLRCEGAVNADGRLIFEGLEAGLYLTVGDVAELQEDGGAKRYAVKASLVALPDQDGRFEATILPKGEALGAEPVDLTVQKNWTGDTEAARPAEIRVQLLRNGAAADEVVLSRENSWQHSWTGLEGGVSWTVLENPVPEGYLPSYSAQGALAIITNAKANPVSGGKLPQTGLMWWPAPVLAAMGAALLLAGWKRSGRHE